MFDPTIYDNLKVVLEGALYDMDLAGRMKIVNRSDQLDLAVLSRQFSMTVELPDTKLCRGEIMLSADLDNLASELLRKFKPNTGCRLAIRFTLDAVDPERHCPDLAGKLRDIWGEEQLIEQRIIQIYGADPQTYSCEITVTFSRTINESQIDDLPSLVEHAAFSLTTMSKIVK